jgi:serine/threonine protein kinase
LSRGAEIGPGSELGDYVLESRLGGGSFGTVWLAHHRAYRSRVAVKALTGALAAKSTPGLRSEVELLAATASSKSQHV